MDEQQRLAFARVLLHAPRWVVLDDGTGALEDEHRQLVRSIFKRELGTAVIDIGRAPGHDHFYTRKLRLARQPGGARLRTGPRPRLVEPAAELV